MKLTCKWVRKVYIKTREGMFTHIPDDKACGAEVSKREPG